MANRILNSLEYLDYREAMKQAQFFENEIRKILALKSVKVYNVYVSVGDEREGTYFLDVEIGGSPETYKRWYGYYTEERIRKMFNIERR